MDKTGTLGIYGGTFSPPHNGHYNALSAFIAECPLDRLYVIPANVPPHKRISPSDEPENRLAMTRLMLEDHPEWQNKLFVSDWEITQKEKSYTVYTLRHFKQYAERIIFLMGTDMLLSLHEWYKPEEICSLADIAFMPREESDPEISSRIFDQINRLKTDYGAKIIQLKSTVLPLDSTTLRRTIFEGKRPEGICDKVYDYIKEHNLYSN